MTFKWPPPHFVGPIQTIISRKTVSTHYSFYGQGRNKLPPARPCGCVGDDIKSPGDRGGTGGKDLIWVEDRFRVHLVVIVLRGRYPILGVFLLGRVAQVATLARFHVIERQAIERQLLAACRLALCDGPSADALGVVPIQRVVLGVREGTSRVA